MEVKCLDSILQMMLDKFFVVFYSRLSFEKHKFPNLLYKFVWKKHYQQMIQKN